jgi:hypothetical protein
MTKESKTKTATGIQASNIEPGGYPDVLDAER